MYGKLKLLDGNQGAGKVLTSDANGIGTWQSLATVGWVNVPTTDTAPFDKACYYRFEINYSAFASYVGTNPLHYAGAVDPFAITWVAHNGVVSFIRASNKAAFLSSAGDGPFTVTRLEKKCGEGGNNTSAVVEAGTISTAYRVALTGGLSTGATNWDGASIYHSGAIYPDDLPSGAKIANVTVLFDASCWNGTGCVNINPQLDGYGTNINSKTTVSADRLSFNVQIKTRTNTNSSFLDPVRTIYFLISYYY